MEQKRKYQYVDNEIGDTSCFFPWFVMFPIYLEGIIVLVVSFSFLFDNFADDWWKVVKWEKVRFYKYVVLRNSKAHSFYD